MVGGDSSFNEVKVEDGENTINEQLGIKGIALEQFRRCCVEGSKEMTRGGKQRKIIDNKYHEIDVPDQREVFFNCVIVLEVILSPYIKNYEDIKGKIDKIKGSIETKKEKCYDLFTEKKRVEKVYYEQLKDDFYSSLLPLYRALLKVLSSSLMEMNYFDEAGGTS